MTEVVTPAHRQQVANWRAMVRVLAAALFSTWIMFAYYVWSSGNADEEAKALQGCRAKSAAMVSSAQVDNDIAFNALVKALSDPTRRAPPKIGEDGQPVNPLAYETQRITDTGNALLVARDARTAFEDHPTGDC